MRLSRRTLMVGTTAGLLMVGGLLAGCSSDQGPNDSSPVTLHPTTAPDGTAVDQVTLRQKAVDRLGITTGTVQEQQVSVDGVTATHKVVPYDAVVYVSDGSSWTYVVSPGNTYVRERITVLTIQGAVAVLSAGPDDGTRVVTQGASELLGAEARIAGEE